MTEIYEFSSELQRMSVIAKDENKYKVYSKGSPEKIKELCNETSLPENYDSILENLSKKGYRILSLAYKETNSNYLKREEAESNLIFAGFLIFENKLKDDTKEVIEKLKNADINIKVLSGDNVLTTIQTARNAGIISPILETILIDIKRDELNQEISLNLEKITSDKKMKDFEDRTKFSLNYEHNIEKMNSSLSKLFDLLNNEKFEFALTGASFEHLFELKKLWKVSVFQKSHKRKLDKHKEPISIQVYKMLLTQVSIFGRMQPFQKALVIQELQKFNISIAMVGDGANDISALKQADIGVSFSEVDASFAAPFISQNFSIDCIEKVLLLLNSIQFIKINISNFYI